MVNRLTRGDHLPKVVTPPPGPRSRQLAARLATLEAPGVNTLYRGQPGIVWQEALGANVLDVDGNLYVDLTAGFGVAALGHRHPAIVAAVAEQAQRLLHGLGDVAAHPARIELAQALVNIAPVDDPVCYFAISGSDAVEIALKTAALATGRSAVLAFDPGYHGLTLGSLAVTSRAEFRRPFGARLFDQVSRLPFGCPLDQIETLLAKGTFGAAIVEPIVGREGVLLPPSGWLTGLAEHCRRRGTLLVADEIYTGFGRTGHRFAVDAEGVRPDLLCCGKALAGGMPLAVVIGRRPLMDSWDHGGEALHTATFMAHPPACAAAIASLEQIQAKGLTEIAQRAGSEIAARVGDWPRRFAPVAEVRGRGLLWGIELRNSRLGADVSRAALERGLLLLVGGPQSQVAQFAPPLTITSEQLVDALTRIEELLTSL